MTETEHTEALSQVTDRTLEDENSTILKGIQEDPQLLRKRIDLINRLGVTGERGIIAIVSSTINSRLIEPDASRQQGTGVKVSGIQGTGKSHVGEGCLKVQSLWSHL